MMTLKSLMDHYRKVVLNTQNDIKYLLSNLIELYKTFIRECKNIRMLSVPLIVEV